jgi:hypothetical protein
MLTDPADISEFMSKQQSRTAKKRLDEDTFVASKSNTSSPARDDGISSEHVKILSSLLYAISFPSSRRQKKTGVFNLPLLG